MTSGVPQGSILGPLLFLFYINDLPNHVSLQTICALFADDAKCYKQIQNEQDCSQLQNDIDKLLLRSQNWDMKFNASKFKLLSVTRKREPITYNYTLGDTSIEKVSNVSDLGVEVSSNLSWDAHVSKIVNKSNRMLGLIQRTSAILSSNETNHISLTCQV